MQVGTVKRGRDGNNWRVVARADGRHYWLRVGSASRVRAPLRPAAPQRSAAPQRRADDLESECLLLEGLENLKGAIRLYDVRIPRPRWESWAGDLTPAGRTRLYKLRTLATNRLKAIGVNVCIVPLPISPEKYYWVDLVWDYALYKVKDPSLATSIIIPVLYMEEDGRTVRNRREMIIQHSLNEPEHASEVSRIMREIFGRAFQWSGSDNETMTLSLR